MVRSSNRISITCISCDKTFPIYEIIYNKHSEFYSKCRKCRNKKKICYICDNIHYKSGETCSKECANKFKTATWINTLGAEHNFSKKSKSRIEWQQRLLNTEGIVNVFQRKEVKEKIKSTISSKYADKLIENISQTEYHKNKMISKGIWKTLDEKDEYSIYRYHVSIFTRESLKKYGSVKFGKNWKSKFFGKNKNSIDHNYSISKGFKNNIPPYIIGSIVNLSIMSIIDNSTKNGNCSITYEELITKFNEFYYENKINKENKIKRYSKVL